MFFLEHYFEGVCDVRCSVENEFVHMIVCYFVSVMFVLIYGGLPDGFFVVVIASLLVLPWLPRILAMVAARLVGFHSVTYSMLGEFSTMVSSSVYLSVLRVVVTLSVRWKLKQHGPKRQPPGPSFSQKRLQRSASCCCYQVWLIFGCSLVQVVLWD
jgi:hypothetical protein